MARIISECLSSRYYRVMFSSINYIYIKLTAHILKSFFPLITVTQSWKDNKWQKFIHMTQVLATVLNWVSLGGKVSAFNNALIYFDTECCCCLLCAHRLLSSLRVHKVQSVLLSGKKCHLREALSLFLTLWRMYVYVVYYISMCLSTAELKVSKYARWAKR